MNFIEVFFIVVIIMLFFMYFQSHNVEVSSVVSNIDGRSYILRNLPDKQQAADLIASTSKKMQTLIADLRKKFPEDKEILMLETNFNPNSISEGTEESKFTSYSINKGEQIVLCLRSKDTSMKLVDPNVLFYVAVHELGHLMTDEVGHTTKFWNNFKRIMQHSVDIGLYEKIDFKKNPHSYCGIVISNSII